MKHIDTDKFVRKDHKSHYLPSNSNNKGDLSGGWDEEVAGGLGISLGLDEGLIGGLVLVEVLLGALHGGGSGDDSIGLCLGSSILDCLCKLLISSLLLKNVFWDNPGSIYTKEKT